MRGKESALSIRAAVPARLAWVTGVRGEGSSSSLEVEAESGSRDAFSELETRSMDLRGQGVVTAISVSSAVAKDLNARADDAVTVCRRYGAVAGLSVTVSELSARMSDVLCISRRGGEVASASSESDATALPLPDFVGDPFLVALT